MIYIDGSYGESGGQMLRTALGLSALTGQAFEMADIRKGRCKPGLMHQHLCAATAMQELCSAAAEGIELNSTKISFIPRKLSARTLSIDIGTAGSITLLLQSLLIPAVFGQGKVRLKMKGGTDTAYSQPYDYMKNVLLPHLRRYAAIECNLFSRGYYPCGQGRVELAVMPKFSISSFDSFSLFFRHMAENAPKIELVEQKRLLMVRGLSHASPDLQKGEVAERQASSCRAHCAHLSVPMKIETEYSQASCTGSGITVWALFGDKETDNDMPIVLGSDALGERDLRAEEVGRRAAEGLVREIGSKAPVDHYLADQLLPYMALSGRGRILVSEVTSHCRTNMHVIEQFLPVRFSISGNEISVQPL